MSRSVSLATVALAIVVAGLGARFGVHLLQLARKGEQRDFAAVYTAAHVYRAGGDFYDPQPRSEHFYSTENPALLDAARRLGTLHTHDEEGIVHVHAFSYPPFAVLAFVPFTALRFRPAAVVWETLGVAALALGGVWLRRAFGLSAAAALTLLAVALLFEPLEMTLGAGQVNSLVLFLLCGFLAALAAGRPALAGASLGLATALRLHPALFFLYLAWRRQWRTLGWAAATAAACTLLAIAVVGWPATVEYATLVAPKYARTFVGVGHSITGWLMTTGAGLLPGVPVGAWRRIGQALSLAALALALAALRPWGPVTRERMLGECAFFMTVVLLVTPNTNGSHLVFALIPLALVLEAALGAGRAALAPWIALAVVLIGAVDDYYAHPLLASGPAVLLRGIKTYGLVILAVLSLQVACRPAPPGRA